MLFNSFDFFCFLPLVLLLYYILPQKSRWILLLLSSYVFYAGWKINYLGLILFSTIIDYLVAKKIFQTQSPIQRKVLLGISLTANFGMLILFKYFHFLIGGSTWFKSLANHSDTILWTQFIFEYGIPVGISFYTFQTVSYTVDVYRRRIEPEVHLGKFALFVSFFPQLVAGPIERFSNLHQQLFKKFTPSIQTFRVAFQYILFGLFIKMVVADSLSPIIAPVFETPLNYELITRWGAVLLFGIQIYADFHGYTTIAIGVALLFGIKLMQNFCSPYGAWSIRDFWSRWHISLSTWFRDYVYIPLGGNKNNRARWVLGIVLTFGLSGLWHGAAVNFIYWGLLHAVYYLLEQSFFPLKKNESISFIEKIIRWFLTSFIVFFGWLLFRIDRMRKVKEFFTLKQSENLSLDLNHTTLFILFIFFFFEFILYKKTIEHYLAPKSMLVRWVIYLTLLISILLCSSTGHFQFIYFQF
jgi:alginate O-acetyltransferase complex protein AlgI